MFLQSSSWRVAAAVCLMAAGPALAAPTNVSLTGTLVNTCILTLSTPGVLTLSSDGTELSSDAVKAVLAVVSTGSAPTISFTAPTLTGPSSSTTGASRTLAYQSLGGAAQAATSGAYSYTANRLLDTVTIDGRAVNAAGFASGTYVIGTTATCQQ